jgi:hypothetical protein
VLAKPTALAITVLGAALALSGGARERETGAPPARTGLAVAPALSGGQAAREPRAAPPRTVVWALGDGADGSPDGRRLARYVRSQRPDRFIYLGDVYERGSAAEYRRNYDAVYGPLARRTDPVLGNHEFARRFKGYFPYWQRARGLSRESARHRAYVDGSGWQVLAYSSESDPVVEAAWVSAHAALHPGTCRLAVGHRGRYAVADSSHGDNPDQEPIWAALAGRTSVNLVAHSHLYGRLAPIDGVHVLVSGAGGHNLRAAGEQRHAVAAARAGVATATRLVLRRGALDFRQVDASGRVHDVGTISCAPAG